MMVGWERLLILGSGWRGIRGYEGKNVPLMGGVIKGTRVVVDFVVID